MSDDTLSAPLLLTLDTGCHQWSAVWRAFSDQWTQTGLMNLSQGYLQTRAIHSSTIGGFRTCKLREPGPKTLVAVGYLNTALARTIGHPEELIEQVRDIGYAPVLPDTLRNYWENTIPILDANNIALGPSGCFEAFCGLRDLPIREQRQIPPDKEQAASQALGAYLRLQFAKREVDWFGSIDTLTAKCPTIRPLLLGETVKADRMLQDLDALAAIVGTTGAAIWDHIEPSLSK